MKTQYFAVRPAVVCGLLISALLMMVPAGCGRIEVKKKPEVDVFAPPTEQTGTAGRTLTCTAKDANGNCDQKECKEGPGGPEYDCAGYAADCVNAGHHWNGTKKAGTCTRVKS